jgi:hypothetical protein
MRSVVRSALPLLALGALAAACSDSAAPSSSSSPEPATAVVPARSPVSVIPAQDRFGQAIYFAAAPQTDGFGYLPLHKQVTATGEGILGAPSPSPSAWGAGDIEDAYAIPPAGGSIATIAIMAGADDPNIESDLAVYRAAFGLPPCSSATGCFTKVNGAGQASPLPGPAWNGDPSAANQLDWATEMSLDVEMASAGCPTCKILLVETNIFSNYAAAWATAARLGATYVSNSWYFDETEFATAAAAQAAEADFDFPGVSFFAGSGDFGYGHDNPTTATSTGIGTAWPAASGKVTAVGGTNLISLPQSPWWSQSAWGGSTAGCSSRITRPSWQVETWAGACGSFRALTDVSALASNVAVYSTWSQWQSPAGDGWDVVGGTSAAGPLTAGIYATNHWTSGPSWPYTSPSSFTDITTGNDCTSGIAEELCYAAQGWDFPTGIGTPKGNAAADTFTASPTTVSVGQNAVGYATLYWGGPWVTPDFPSVYAISSSAPAGVLTVTYPSGQGATLQITPSFNTPEGAYPVTVYAEVPQTGVTHTASLTVDVTGCAPAVCPANSCGTLSAPYTCSQTGTIACGTCASGEVCSDNVCCPSGDHWDPTAHACVITCTAGKAYCPATGGCAIPALCNRLGGRE